VLGASVTNSGLFLTPMMGGLIVASVISGQVMVRIKRYHFLGTFGLILVMVGIYLVSQTTTATPQWRVTIAIILVGLGLGTTFPLYINAVQSALPQRYLGVGTSQIQFWRNVGGTVSSAVLGTILAQRLPGAIHDQLAKVTLPPGFKVPASLAGSNPNALLNPAAIAAAKAKVPAAIAPLFDQIIHAVREALALTLHDLFLIAVVLVGLALIASLFMPDVPLRAQRQPAFAETPGAAEGAA
jgi:MFS family permease